MSIVEAMSAGVVPVAFDAGGPRETINPGIDGYLWNNLLDLRELSLGLIENPELLQSMSMAAIRHSKAFDVVQFLGRMDQLIEKLAATRISWLAQAKHYIRRRHGQS